MKNIKLTFLLFSLICPLVFTGQCNYTVELGSDTVVCLANDSFQLVSNITPSVGPYTYEWTSLSDTQDINLLSDVGVHQPFFNQYNSGNHEFIYELQVYDTVNACSVSDTISIIIEQGYGMNLLADTSICNYNFQNFSFIVDTALTVLTWQGWAAGQVSASEDTLHVFYDSLYMNGLGINYLPNSVLVYDSATGCEAKDTFHVYIDTCDLVVWPGDVNNDNIVNMLDILPIGITAFSSGPARSDDGFLFSDMEAIRWEEEFVKGLDYAYADCNGDGMINDIDIGRVMDLYSSTHLLKKKSSAKPVRSSAFPIMQCLFNEDSVLDESTVYLNISLGDSLLGVNNLYGVAYSLFFDPAYVVDGSFVVDFYNSLLGLSVYNISYEFPSAGQLDVAIVKNDQNDTSGFGDVTGIKFILEDIIAGSSLQKDSFTFGFGNIQVIDKNYNIIDVEPLTDTVLIYQSLVTELIEADLNSIINVFPNPAKEMFYITRNKAFVEETSVYVYDLYGKMILSYEDVASWPLKIQTGHWSSGIYILDININAYSQKKRLIIE